MATNTPRPIRITTSSSMAAPPATTHRSWAADRLRRNTMHRPGSIGRGATPGRCSAGSSSIAAASLASSRCRPASNASPHKRPLHHRHRRQRHRLTLDGMASGALFKPIASPKRAKKCLRRHRYLHQSCEKVITNAWTLRCQARTVSRCAPRAPPNSLTRIHIMATGTVKWFNSTKGFGFIQPDGGGKDVFVHISAVERAGLNGLNEGQKITYDVQQDRGKDAATNLKSG